MNKEHNVAVILLAAGQSSRLGQPKQLLTFTHQSLIRHQAKLALSFTEHVYCVLGFSADSIKKELNQLPVNIVINENWLEGLSSSIAAGIKQVNKKVTSVLIVLVDQWQLTLKDFNLFAQQSGNSHSAILAATNVKKGELSAETIKLGPPVLFPQQYFSALSQLTGDKGAKPLLKKYAHVVNTIEMPHAFIDIDTPQQLDYFIKNNHLFTEYQQ